MTQGETDPRSRFAFTLATTFVWLVSRPLPSRQWRELALWGALEPITSSGWRVRVLSARYDEIWGRDITLQKRSRTLLLPEPELLADDELLAVTLNRLDRLGFQVPWADNLSLALASAHKRLRVSATGWGG